MFSSRLRLLALSAGLIGLVVAASTAAADPLPGAPRDTILWTNPAGGSWTDASNWSPANVPDTPDEAAVMKPLSGGYVVTLGASYVIGGLRVDGGGPALTVNAATLQINGIPLNRGTIRISGAGTLRCYYPLFQNRGGTVVAGDGGGNFTVCGPYPESPGTIDNTLNGYTTTSGGTLVSDGGDLTVYCGALLNGEVQRTSGDKAVKVQLATPQNLTVAANAEMVVTGQIDLMADGSSLINHGTVRVPGWVNVGGNSNCAVTLAGDGVMVLEAGTLNTPAGATMVNAAGHTIRGCGTILATLVNYGELEVDCPFSFFAVPGALRNYNTMRVQGGLMWLKNSGTHFWNAATLTVTGGGALWIDNGATLDNSFGVLAANGSVELGGSTSCTILRGRLEGTFNGRGTTTLTDVTLGPTADFRTLANATTIAAGARLVNQGTQRIDAQGTLAIGATTDYVQTGGATVLTGGSLTSSRELQIQGGELRGVGTIAADVASSGEVSPDAGSGILTIQGDYRQLADGRLNVGLASASAISRLGVTGTATLDGVIETSAIGGFNPAPGSHFEVLSYGSLSGQFSDYVDNLQGQVDLVPAYGPDGFELGVSAIVGVGDPAPAPVALRFFGHREAGVASFVLELPRAAKLTVRLYDASGREVAALADGERPAGAHRFALAGTDGAAITSGMYFARAIVESAGQMETRTARVIHLR